MTTVFLHVGTHKTGSTTLQTFAARHRDKLKDLGLYYPVEPGSLSKASSNSHHGWAAALAGDDPKVSAMAAREMAAEWIRDAQESRADLLVSAESMYRHTRKNGGPRSREGYVRQLRKTFDGQMVRVVPILVFRHPADFIESLYKEIVMVTPRTDFWDFREFREMILAREGGHLAYYRNASILKQNFPELKCAVFEDLLGKRPLEVSFFDFLGFDVASLSSVGRVRESANSLATELKQLANSWGFDAARNWEVYNWLRSGETTADVEKVIGAGPHDLWKSESEREAFMGKMAGQLEALRKDFFPGRDFLFPAPKALVGKTVPALPDEVKTRLRQAAVEKGILPR